MSSPDWFFDDDCDGDCDNCDEADCPVGVAERDDENEGDEETDAT